MSKLNELIKQFCPDGVEYKTLGEIIIKDIGGGTPSKSKKEYWKNGTIPWASIKDVVNCNIYLNKTKDLITKDGLVNSTSNIIPKGEIIISTRINLGKMTITGTEIAINQDLRGIIVNQSINKKFLVYYFQTLEIKGNGTTVKGINIEELKKLPVPIPPLPIQAEIVKVLDNFTTLTAELQAELQARKTQYEYYRNALLDYKRDEFPCTPDNSVAHDNSPLKDSTEIRQNHKDLHTSTDCKSAISVEWKTLGECCILKAGNSISSAEIHKFRDNKYMFPCYGGNGIRGYVNKFSNEGEFPIIGRQGALCGNISYAKGKYYSTEHAVTVNSNKSFIPRFLYYLLITLNLNQYATAGAQPGLSVNRINRIYVPIPPLSEQERIVAILDKFDALINDISIGLPAEIAALQKKYEYYRNKLLTFDALEAK